MNKGAKKMKLPLSVTDGHPANPFQTAAERFRKGEDAAGLECFLTATAELESLVEADQILPRPRIGLDRLLPAVRQLHFYMQNQDITGIADFLEDTICPMTQEWLQGSDGV